MFAGADIIVGTVLFGAFVALLGYTEQLGFIGGREAPSLVFQFSYAVSNALDSNLAEIAHLRRYA